MVPETEYLTAILAQPSDDTPRLICADFFEEQGEPERAQLIRVQCELFHLPRWERRAKELRYRQWQLLCSHSRRWCHELPVVPDVEWGRFERGFVSEVCVPSLEVWLREQDRIQAISPVFSVRTRSLGLRDPLHLETALHSLRHLAITCSSDEARELGRLFRSACCQQLQTLELTYLDGPPLLFESLAEASALQNLKALRLDTSLADLSRLARWLVQMQIPRLQSLQIHVPVWSNAYRKQPSELAELMASILTLIGESSAFARLGELVLPAVKLDAESMNILFGSKVLANLKSLQLDSCVLEGEAHWQAVDNGARWEELHLPGTHLSTPWLRTMMAHPQVSELKSLNLARSRLNRKGWTEMANADTRHSLRELNLSQNELTGEVATTLGTLDWPELHTLNLASAKLNSNDLIALAENCRLPALIDLDLSDNEIHHQTTIAISRASWAPRLRRLSLRHTRLKAVEILADSARFCQLWSLDLGQNSLSEEGLLRLLDVDWSELTELNLSDTQLSDAGIRKLIRSGIVENLIALNIGGCPISSQAFVSLARARAPELNWMQIQSSRIGPEGLFALTQADWPNLVWVRLNDCGLGCESIRTLIDSPLGRRLRRCSVWGNAVPSDLGSLLARLEEGRLWPDHRAESPISESVW